MSTPFQRLRLVIDNVGVNRFQTTTVEMREEEPEETDVYECNRYTVSHSREKSREKLRQKYQPRTQYYTKQDMHKITSLYQKQKQRSHRLEIENERLSRQLGLRDESMSELNRTWGAKQKQMEQTKMKSIGAESENYLRLLGEKERVYKEEIEKLIEIGDHLNRELNSVRQKHNLLLKESEESIREMNREIEGLRGEVERKGKEIRELEGNIEERKKLIEYNITSHQQNLKRKEREHEVQCTQLTGTIDQLRTQIQELNKLGESGKDRHRELETQILTLQHSIQVLKQTVEAQEAKHHQSLQQSEGKIQTMVKSLERYQGVERRNEELERLIEEEKAKEKYHIVEVKDETLELEVEMLKGQVKELLKSKAIAEEKLKRSCNCLRTTLLMKDQEGFGETIKYMQGHEIKIVKQ